MISSQSSQQCRAALIHEQGPPATSSPPEHPVLPTFLWLGCQLGTAQPDAITRSAQSCCSAGGCRTPNQNRGTCSPPLLCHQDQPHGHKPEGFLPRGGCDGTRHCQAAPQMMDAGFNALFCASLKDLRLIARASCVASTAGSAQPVSCLCCLPGPAGLSAAVIIRNANQLLCFWLDSPATPSTTFPPICPVLTPFASSPNPCYL